MHDDYWRELAEYLNRMTAVDTYGARKQSCSENIGPFVRWDMDADWDRITGPAALLIVPSVAQQLGLVRYKELRGLGVQKCHIQYCFENGTITRAARGIFTHPTVSTWQRSTIAQVASKRRDVIAILRTAAMLWRLVPWSSAEPLWFACDRKKKPLKLEFAVNWIRWSPKKLAHGIRDQDIGGVPLYLTTPARTIADYFAHHRRVRPGEPHELLAAYRASQHWDESALIEAAKFRGVLGRVTTALRFG